MSLPINSEAENDTLLTISDVSRKYNVSSRALRFYEAKSLLKPRRVGNMRYYSELDTIRLELILNGKRLGFSLGEIWDLIYSRSKGKLLDGADLTSILSKAEIQTQIAFLEQQRAALADAIADLKRAYDRAELLGISPNDVSPPAANEEVDVPGA